MHALQPRRPARQVTLHLGAPCPPCTPAAAPCRTRPRTAWSGRAPRGRGGPTRTLRPTKRCAAPARGIPAAAGRSGRSRAHCLRRRRMCLLHGACCGEAGSPGAHAAAHCRLNLWCRAVWRAVAHRRTDPSPPPALARSPVSSLQVAGQAGNALSRLLPQVEDFQLRTFDAKRDRWNGYDSEDWVKQAER